MFLLLALEVSGGEFIGLIVFPRGREEFFGYTTEPLVAEYVGITYLLK